MDKEFISLNYIYNFIKTIKDFDNNNNFIKKEKILLSKLEPFENKDETLTQKKPKKTKSIHIYEYVHSLLFGYHVYIYIINDKLYMVFLNVDMSEILITMIYESDMVHLESLINYLLTDFILKLDRMVN